MKPDPRAPQRRATLVILFAAALWVHAWMPAAVVVAFVLWALFHTRYQGHRREAFMRFRARVWPPATLVLVTLIVGGTAVYVVSTDAIEAKVLPIALNVVALAILVIAWIRSVGMRVPPEASRVDALATKGGPA